MFRYIVSILVAVTMGCACAVAASFSQPNATYNVTSVVTGFIHVGDNSTLVFSGKGMFKDATITGHNLKVVTSLSTTIFKNCDFSVATFANSSLKASNFGLVNDMTTQRYNYTFKGKRFNTQLRKGTDNSTALQMLAQFLSGSNGVKIVINGNYFSSKQVQTIKIGSASNMELCGTGTLGSLVMGLVLNNCKDCSIHDLKFVGFHSVHDFPPVYASKFPTVNGVTYSAETAYNYGKYGGYSCGIAADAIQLIPKVADSSLNRNFNIYNCHFEMRSSGLVAGVRSKSLIVRNVNMHDCTFDHIYFQPVGLHCSGAKINNVTGRYSLQGLDMSAGTNNATATNCIFNDCACGPKQESITDLMSMSHHNVIDGCTFGINEKYMLLDAAQYILNVAEGLSGDTFTVRNSTFNVSKNRVLSSVMTRAYRTVLENVTFNIDVDLDSRNTAQYSMNQFFAVYGKSSFEPQLELSNVTVNLSNSTTLNTLVTPAIDIPFHLTASNLTVNGSNTLNTYFDRMATVSAQYCNLATNVKNVATRVNNFTVDHVTAPSVEQSFVLNNVADAKLTINNSDIKTKILVNCKQQPAQLSVSGNRVSVSHTEAITDLDATRVSSSKIKISGNTFTGTQRGVRIMNNNSMSRLPSVARQNTVR